MMMLGQAHREPQSGLAVRGAMAKLDVATTIALGAGRPLAAAAAVALLPFAPPADRI